MWFVRLGGKEAGPYSEDRLRAMLRLNQFSAMYQVSRNKIQWESAAALVRQLNGTDSGSSLVSTTDKWVTQAKIRQAARANAEAPGRTPPTENQNSKSITQNKNNPGSPPNARETAPNAPKSGTVSVQIHQASKSVIDSNTGGVRILLHPVSISLLEGELIAVIGPSGSGKSTWLGLLTGRALPTTGRITVYGRDLNREFATVKRSISAVPQMDAFLTSLKVRTSLFYSACLRLPKNTPRSQLKARVESVLGSVGLDECGDRRISQLSGGQLRRLSLAQELLSDPDVLYLDEVTSGLDEQSDAAIMALLRKLSSSGRTIMIITHHLHNLQDNCHKIVVLAAGGYMVFFGSPKEACTTFNVSNVTEVLPAVKAMSREDVVKRCENGTDGDWQPPDNAPLPSPQPIKSSLQKRHVADFFVLIQRQIAVLVSAPMSTVMSVFICFTIGALLYVSFPNLEPPSKPKDPTKLKGYAEDLGKITLDSGNLAFILTVSSFFLGCLAGTRELVMERRLFWRESGTEMSIFSYLSSKLVVQTLLTTIQASGLGVAVMYLVHADCSLVGVAIANSSVAISGLCTGFFISAASRSEAVATKMMLLAVLPQMILSGALKRDPPPFMKMLSQLLITSHYGFQCICGLYPKDVRPPYTPIYTLGVVIAITIFHSAIMLGATAFFLRRTATGEDPVRGE